MLGNSRVITTPFCKISINWIRTASDLVPLCGVVLNHLWFEDTPVTKFCILMFKSLSTFIRGLASFPRRLTNWAPVFELVYCLFSLSRLLSTECKQHVLEFGRVSCIFWYVLDVEKCLQCVLSR
jgi:hypothetical protein